jgi:hypothetical protein
MLVQNNITCPACGNKTFSFVVKGKAIVASKLVVLVVSCDDCDLAKSALCSVSDLLDVLLRSRLGSSGCSPSIISTVAESASSYHHRSQVVLLNRLLQIYKNFAFMYPEEFASDVQLSNLLGELLRCTKFLSSVGLVKGAHLRRSSL